VFCAYHSSSPNNTYIYTLIPYLKDSQFSNCIALLGGAGSNSFAAAATTALSHEYAEAVTDPLVTNLPAWAAQLKGLLAKVSG
jgi:hypothetical protein